MERETQVVLNYFGKPDLNQVSKRALVKEFAKHREMVGDLTVDLFCAQPGHRLFRKKIDNPAERARHEHMLKMLKKIRWERDPFVVLFRSIFKRAPSA